MKTWYTKRNAGQRKIYIPYRIQITIKQSLFNINSLSHKDYLQCPTPDF